MSILTSGFIKACVFDPLTGDTVVIPKIAVDQSEYTPETIKSETTDGVLFGGYSKTLALGFFDDTGLAQLKTWMQNRTKVGIFIQSRGKNILWEEYTQITVIEGVATNSRDGLQVHALQMEAHGSDLDIYEFQNLAEIVTGTSRTIVAPIEAIKWVLGGNASLGSYDITITFQNFAGSTQGTLTVTVTGGDFDSDVLSAPSGTYKLIVDFVNADVDDRLLRTDGIETLTLS